MIESFVQKYRRKGILIDSNLLIGLLVGILGPSHLRNCRATKSFTEEDFWLLKRFVDQFKAIITTPHILTEVSNLAGRLPDDLAEEFRHVFRNAIEQASEHGIPARQIVTDSVFVRLGLTDTAIAMGKPNSHLVLTDELQLCKTLSDRKIDVINFNHIRAYGWT